MQPLNKLPAYCMCSSVNCTFQDSNFLTNAVETMLTENHAAKTENQAAKTEIQAVKAEKQAMKADYSVMKAKI